MVVRCLYSDRDAYAGIRISLGMFPKKLLDKNAKMIIMTHIIERTLT